MNETKHAASTDEPVIVLSRVFDAPRDLVWAAWTDPKQLALWWGPHGFTNPVVEVDARVGGYWRIDMQGADGTIYPNKGKYLEVVPPERIVFTDVVDEDEVAWGDTPPPSSVSTVTLEERDGKTTLTLVTRLASIEERDKMLELGSVEGLSESMERLDALLGALTATT